MRALPLPVGEVPPEGSGGSHVGPKGRMRSLPSLPLIPGEGFFRSLGKFFAAADVGFSEFIQSDKKVLAISRIYWYNICNWYASQKLGVRKQPT